MVKEAKEKAPARKRKEEEEEDEKERGRKGGIDPVVEAPPMDVANERGRIVEER